MVADELAPVIPVVLSGGSGTRRREFSRSGSPEQFVPLLSGLSLFQETVCRARAVTPQPPVVVCGVEHRGLVEDQLGHLRVTPAAILCEPVARSTTLAVAAAALTIADDQAGALMLVLPSDDLVGDVQHFVADVAAAAPAAAAGYMVTFGITPTAPEVGWGYVKLGPALDGTGRVYAADEFVEKPDRDRAQSFVRQGGWLWNSGMMLVSRRDLIAELSKHGPSVAFATELATSLAERDSDAMLLNLESFSTALSIALDRAVMERTDRAAALATAVPWSRLPEVSDEDGDGSAGPAGVFTGDASTYDLRGLDPLVRAAVLVADRDRCHEVGDLLERLQAPVHTHAVPSSQVCRPWGSYRVVDKGRRHQVKRIVVEPGHRLSLQKHRQRAEHWVIVQGTASIVRGTESLVLHENDFVFIPVDWAHRLENPGSTPLHLVEVQIGDYLGEDDIERLADDYGRT